MTESRRLFKTGFTLVTWGYIAAGLILGWTLTHSTTLPITAANPLLRPEQVIAFLSSVATGMMAFTGIVFSLLFILMQFGSSAYSPHLVAMLARNPVLVHAQGVFTGTFLYALMALRGVGSLPGDRTPAITVWVALIWLLASVYLLVRLVDVFAHLEITDVLDMLGEAGRRAIRRAYAPLAGTEDGTRPEEARLVAGGSAATDDDAPENGTGTRQIIVHHGKPSYVGRVDVVRLAELARAADAVVRVPVAVGDSVTTGVVLAVIEGGSSVVPVPRLREAIALRKDRTPEGGPKHAMRLLVDIAIRSVSMAVNDPTTAVHALDQIEDLLLRLGNVELDVGRVRDPSGRLRVAATAATWDDYLDLGLTEIRYYGASAIQVERRLAALLDRLRAGVPASRRPAVERYAAAREATIRAAFARETDRNEVHRGDRQGIGHSEVGA
jgi:uncharacterized membrane protein